jgi:hypothetical protein
MTAPPARRGIADPAPPEEGPGRVAELPAGQCTRCGAVGTHYLTCPSLRLPPGYRLSGTVPQRGRGTPGAGHVYAGHRTDDYLASLYDYIVCRTR